MFKVGDKVRRKAQYRNVNEWGRMATKDDGIVVVKEVYRNGNSISVDGAIGGWDADRFELVEEKTVVEKQVPGVPNGYRLVRIGGPEAGEYYIVAYGVVNRAAKKLYDLTWAIVEPVTPPKPKTVTVVINKYLVGDLADPRSLYVAYCTQDYMEQACVPYRLLGVSETLEVEVDV